MQENNELQLVNKTSTTYAFRIVLLADVFDRILH